MRFCFDLAVIPLTHHKASEFEVRNYVLSGSKFDFLWGNCHENADCVTTRYIGTTILGMLVDSRTVLVLLQHALPLVARMNMKRTKSVYTLVSNPDGHRAFLGIKRSE